MVKCNFCGKILEECFCKEKRMWNNMIDSSVFLGAYDEGEYSEDCKTLIEGTGQRKYFGTITTLILGEIMNKLIGIKKEDPHRFESIFEELLDILSEFHTYYICKETIDLRKNIHERHPKESHDLINLACAIKNKCSLFIMLDDRFSQVLKKGETEVVQITDRNHPKLKVLLNKLNIF